MIKFIKTREGDDVAFDRSRIERAIERAAEAANTQTFDFIESLTDEIIHRLWEKYHQQEHLIDVETIQDMVEEKLMECGHYDIAKIYILYREKRRKEREKRKAKVQTKLEEHSLEITKSNGEKEIFDREKVKNTYKRVSFGLHRKCKFETLETSLKKYLVDGMQTKDIMRMMIKSAIDLISVENTAWQYIAGRLTTIDLYKEAARNRGIPLVDMYSPQAYKHLFDDYIQRGWYYKDFYKYYSEADIIQAGKKLNTTTDFSYNYTTLTAYKKRYLLNPNNVIRELPQEMYMSIALFLAIPEKEDIRLTTAFEIYEYCSQGMISLPTPTLLNARTNFHQLSSCFVLNADDDLRSIYHTIENIAQISKYGGGVGVYLGNIRSKGGNIRGIKGASGGVNPWIKVINDTAVAVNQL
jgi:ribonucleoside-diphosphate reductase alpha chain